MRKTRYIGRGVSAALVMLGLAYLVGAAGTKVRDARDTAKWLDVSCNGAGHQRLWFVAVRAVLDR